MKKLFFHLVFLIIVVGDLTGEYLQLKWIDYAFKPFIMIWIGSYFLVHAKNVDNKIIRLTITAFLFSWVGDILLMFGEKGFNFFILGLVSFLVAQILYVFLFLRTIKLSGKRSYFKKNPYWLIAYIAYGLIIYIVLYNSLEGVLKIAVFIYILAILSMSSMALNRFGNGHPLSFTFVFIGSLLFVLSDSLIAVNRFLTPIPYEGIFVMSTYISAQYLIMKGLLKQYE